VHGEGRVCGRRNESSVPRGCSGQTNVGKRGTTNHMPNSNRGNASRTQSTFVFRSETTVPHRRVPFSRASSQAAR
jgi:hypothetical protein